MLTLSCAVICHHGPQHPEFTAQCQPLHPLLIAECPHTTPAASCPPGRTRQQEQMPHKSPGPQGPRHTVAGHSLRPMGEEHPDPTVHGVRVNSSPTARSLPFFAGVLDTQAEPADSRMGPLSIVRALFSQG